MAVSTGAEVQTALTRLQAAALHANLAVKAGAPLHEWYLPLMSTVTALTELILLLDPS